MPSYLRMVSAARRLALALLLARIPRHHAWMAIAAGETTHSQIQGGFLVNQTQDGPRKDESPYPRFGVFGIWTSGCSPSTLPVAWWLRKQRGKRFLKCVTAQRSNCVTTETRLPRLCFLVSNASSVANKVFGKRMKILDLQKITTYQDLSAETECILYLKCRVSLA